MGRIETSSNSISEDSSLPRIDLHTHTTASDGSLSPAQLVQYAKHQGLHALAVTDHDTIAGLADAIAEGERLGVRIIPGIELSCFHQSIELHILGYFIDPLDPHLRPALLRYQSSREERNLRIIERLRELGLDITYQEVKTFAALATVGRPHIAQVLLQKGYVYSVADAFSRYLGDDGPAYIARTTPDAPEAIALIRRIGGVPVLAHPIYAARARQSFERLCAALKNAGLWGLETVYSGHTQQQTDRLRAVAREQGLGISGGSDFHGESRPEVLLGSGYGNLKIPAALLEPIEALARKRVEPVPLKETCS
jgi:3',5'-nucleoside bisphosphate phosphatase